MASNHDPRGGMIDGINVTPLVDIMLVLLIIFMVSSAAMTPHVQAVGVTLPQGQGEGVANTVLAIAIRTDGSVLVDGAPATDDAAFVAHVRQITQAHPEVKAIVQADAHAYHASVIHVMELLTRAGVAQIGFAVQPGQP